MCGICGCDEENNMSQDHHDHHSDDQKNMISIEQDILHANNQLAKKNRDYFNAKNIAVINLVSSPGSGKTTWLVKTIKTLKHKIALAVIEGDQHTQIDADRIRETKIPVVQINTGKMCHLDAHSVGHAIEEINPEPNSILFIENVGNLICPALFDLGETARVVFLSVTEGEDKPLKYPHIFRHADVMIITKMDLLPYVTFDVDKAMRYAKQINPTIEILQTSATTGLGLQEWHHWILGHHKNEMFSN